MAKVQLGTKNVGSVVKIKVNGTAKEFLIVHQGRPSSVYDSSCTGTWVLMKDSYESRGWHSSWDNSYAGSDIHSYLNSTFLALIDSSIKSQIKQVKIPYRKGSGTSTTVTSGSSGLSAKIFLLSATETSFSFDTMPSGEGSELSYFKGCADNGADSKRIAKLNGSASYWWLRSPSCYVSSNSLAVVTSGNWVHSDCRDYYGIRPAFILPTTLLVDTDGTVSVNSAPTVPGSITVPAEVKGGSSITVSWAASSDADGNLSGYILERSVGGGTYTQVYKGSAKSYTDSITKGWNTVAYRVKAYDALNAASGYRTSATRTVNNNTAPVVTSSDTTLGTQTEPFTFTYTVTDADGDTLTVTEQLDGVTTATHTEVASGTALTFGQANTAEGFQKILNGSHTIQITASDGKATGSISATFTKAVYAASITLTQPLAVEGDITMAALAVSGSIPEDANFKVEVTNNGADPSPVWQDVTSEVKRGVNIIFENGTASAGAAFNFRVTVSRGASGVGGYIESVVGAFQ